MMRDDFLGLNNFVWWFGVVENRLDPLELGRCQVRCFGWHTEDINQIPIDKLPWAHPVVPYGVKNVQPPPEGTMVFGFFADGKEGRYPIIMGTVPGVPEEIRQNNMGFTDPYTDEEKAASALPRKVKDAKIKADSLGVQITNDVPRRNPANLNEPTLSRLARPTRGELDGEYDGIASESIANTAIDVQRKTRIVNIPTAKAGSTWDEPYPSFNAKYPFNDVTETESGHAFEMDDTPDFERVQLSHRTGSTLEFLPEGHTKIKSQKGRYDVTMGDHRNYVNGDKYETIDADFFVRVNGKFRIECDEFELVCRGNPGTAKITAEQRVDLKAGAAASMSAPTSGVSGGIVTIDGVKTNVIGGAKLNMSSGGMAAVGAPVVSMSGTVVETDAQITKTHGIQDLNSCLPIMGKVDVPEPPLQDVGKIDVPPPNFDFGSGG